MDHLPNLGILQKLIPGSEISLLETLNTISNKFSVVKMICEKAKSSEKYINSIARNSYFHQGGFHKIIVDSLGEYDYQLRLHFWEKSSLNSEMSDIHNHSWNFATTILSGGYSHKIFGEAESGVELCLGIRPSRKVAQPQKIELFEKIKMSVIYETRLNQGDFYYLDNSAYHKVYNPLPCTCSLVLQGPHVKLFSASANDKNTLISRGVIPTFNSEEEVYLSLEKILNATTFKLSV